VRDQTDLQFAAPSLSMTQVGFTENVNIRGIGINLQSPVVVSGVALYRDGLFYPGNIMADEPYYDVADVEILRGPQGTFVGQNSTCSGNPNTTQTARTGIRNARFPGPYTHRWRRQTPGS
jgi:iron complex outermembrane receptor protein